MVSTNSTSRSFTPHGVGVSVVVLIGTAQHRCGPWNQRSTSTHALRIQNWKSSKLKSTSLVYSIVNLCFLALVSSKENVCACNAPRVSRC